MSEVAAITLAWLVRLRWGAVVGQIATLAVAAFVMKLDLPLAKLGALVAVTAASNAGLALRAKDASSRTTAAVFAFDTLVLTGLLYLSGGPSNPFSVLYLVHVTLAALVLGFRWAAGIVALSALSYGALFFWHVPVDALGHAHHGASPFSVHLQGMWVAFTVAAALIAYFVARLAAALRQREADLSRAQRIAARGERLASLSTLAAGAAHELGTPLATIAVASRELERTAQGEALEDARLIRAEVERCREIVQRMAARAGDAMGEVPERTAAPEVLRRLTARARGLERVDVEIARTAPFVCPVDGLVEVLANLVQNALHASEERVTLRADVAPRSVQFVVEDRGAGVPAELLPRVGEPFFTTKAPGEGMGLGLFLANAFADRCGGRLAFASEVGRGTRVTLELPRLEDPHV